MVLVYSLKDGGQKKFSDRFPTAMANLIEADFVTFEVVALNLPGLIHRYLIEVDRASAT